MTERYTLMKDQDGDPQIFDAETGYSAGFKTPAKAIIRIWDLRDGKCDRHLVWSKKHEGYIVGPWV